VEKKDQETTRTKVVCRQVVSEFITKGEKGGGGLLCRRALGEGSRKTGIFLPGTADGEVNAPKGRRKNCLERAAARSSWKKAGASPKLRGRTGGSEKVGAGG